MKFYLLLFADFVLIQKAGLGWNDLHLCYATRV